MTLTALLANARIPIQLDAGFGDVIVQAARIESIPTLLDFPAPRIRTYPPEAVITEKFQTMVPLGIVSTRLKDDLDIWTLAETPCGHPKLLHSWPGQTTGDERSPDLARRYGVDGGGFWNGRDTNS